MPRIFLIALLAAAAATLVLATGASAQTSRADRQDVVPGSYIVVFKDSVGPVDREADKRERRGNFNRRMTFRRALKGFSARLSPRQVEQLRDDPAVESVTPNRVVHARGTLASGEQVPFGVQRMGAGFDGANASANSASSVGVAVIDTGVDLDHPDLDVADGVNCVTPGAPADDDDGHGSHVAGSIGGKNTGSGVVGVAPGTKLHAVKVLDANGGGTWEQIICGIDWVTANAAARDIKVANMSLGGLGSSADNQPCGSGASPLHEAICGSTTAGVRYVVAAGNDGWQFPHATLPDVPSSYDEVVTVTAMGDSDGRSGAASPAPACTTGEADDRYASFSNYSDNATDNAHTVAAPGVCVNSAAPGGGHATMSGTSMASPHAAGATALCIGQKADDGSSVAGPCAGLTKPADVIAQIRSTDPAHGFTGDPTRPVSGRYYGYMAVAGTPLAAPSFALAASPASQSVYRGSGTSYGVTVTPQAGFSSAVTLSVSGLPGRTSASFSPNPTTSSSTLRVSTSSRTSRGTYTLTIKGVGGGVTRTTKVTLTVR